MLSNVSCIKQDQVSGVFSPWENTFNIQKQPSRGVLKKRCSENMLSIFRRTSKPKCDFNKVALHRYWNHTSAWVFSCIYLFTRLPLMGCFCIRKLPGFSNNCEQLYPCLGQPRSHQTNFLSFPYVSL